MKYFTIRELTKSETAIRKRIDNIPNKEQEENLRNLVKYILDPLREEYGKPIVVTSGFRCHVLNDILGGSKTSQHKNGEAADIRTIEDTREENKKLFDLIIKLNLPFDQLINENNFDWIHVSYSNKNRKQILKL